MTPTYRVSNLAAYARWKQQDGDDLGWLHQAIFGNESNESMSRGTAFHAALETAMEGEYQTVEAQGYTFAFTCDAELYLPKTREIRKAKDYGGIIVTGQCDGIEGRCIIDHKTVQQFDAEYHLEGWQHRFYLDIFEADRFDWHIWEVAEMHDPKKVINAFMPGAPPNGEHAMDAYNAAINELAGMRTYEVYAHHLLTQYRYPALENDCRTLALEFRDFTARMGWNSKAA